MTQWCFLDYVNLPFHEAGHVFLRPFGETMHFLGGTLFQLLVPALLVWYFLVRVPNRFAAALCFWWVGENLINISIYMADARELNLPLVGGGHHDWNHLFYAFGVLDQPSVELISGTTFVLGCVVMLVGLAWGSVMVLPEPRGRLVRGWLVARVGWLERLLER